MDSRAAILRELEPISLCQLTDAIGPSCTIETGIKPIDPEFRICGPAITVSCARDDNLTLHHALHIAPAGSVLVVNGGGSCDAALWGELMSFSAQTRNLKGTIIDGAARDALEIKNMGYPVFSRAITPRQAIKRTYGSVNSSIQCGSLVVNPGDFIIADVNGMIAISEARLREVLPRALEIDRNESGLKKQIRSGRSIFEILGLDVQISQ